MGRRGREDAWTSYVHFNLYIYIQWATNNNNFDTTSEIMFLALDPPRPPKNPKICSGQSFFFVFFEKNVSVGEKQEKMCFHGRN